jgi:hypothetical protein
MKRYNILFVAIGCWLLTASFSGDGNSTFSALLEKASMNFVKPANTIETPVIVNDELNYQYAIKDTSCKIEIRYLVYPLQDLINKYNGPHADSGISRIDPNFLHTNFLLALSLKIEGKQMDMQEALPALKELSHATADLEFNADWAASIDVQPCDEFAQKYKYCTVFAIHKDNDADAFVIYLYDNKDTFEELVKPDFHSLTFKKG